MRSLALALLALAFSASPAVRGGDRDRRPLRGCDGSSDESDTRELVVRAAPGETNVITVTRGAARDRDRGHGRAAHGRAAAPQRRRPLLPRALRRRGRLPRRRRRPARPQRLRRAVAGGPGDDDIRVTNALFTITGGPGADRLDATGARTAQVSYVDHTDGRDRPAERAAPTTAPPARATTCSARSPASPGGAATTCSRPGARPAACSAAAGDDTLVGSPERDYLHGREGDDDIAAARVTTACWRTRGRTCFSGGPGLDAVELCGTDEPLRLSIGDGPNDGAAGEGDDIREDVEGLSGGGGDDLLIGDDDANRLIAYGGQRRAARRGRRRRADRLGRRRRPGRRARARTRGRGWARSTARSSRTARPTGWTALGRAVHRGGRVRHAQELRPAPARPPRGPAANGPAPDPVLRCPATARWPVAGACWPHLRTRPKALAPVRFGPIEPAAERAWRVRRRGVRAAHCLSGALDANIRRGDDAVVTTRSVVSCQSRAPPPPVGNV